MLFLQQHRLILLFSAMAIVLGGLELSGQVQPTAATSTDRISLSEESGLILQLYPNSPEADYVRGMRARHLRFDLQVARQHFEKALASGIKAHHSLMYDYAVVLFLMEAPQDEVDAAIDAWKKNDPAAGAASPRSFHLPFPEWNKPGSLKVMSLCANGRLFASVTDTGEISWIDLPTGERGKVTPPKSGRPDHLLGFAPDGRFLLAADATGAAMILDIRANHVKHFLAGHKQVVTSGEFSPDGNTCATGDLDGEIRIWNSQTGAQVSALIAHSHPVSALGFTRHSRMLASADRQGIIRLWDSYRSEPESVVVADCSAAVTAVAFSVDNRMLATASRDSLIRVFDIRSKDCLQTLEGHTAPVSSVAFSASGRLLASGSADRTVRFWDVLSGEPVGARSLSGEDGVCALTFSERGDVVIAADFNGSVHPVRLPRTGTFNR
ncbi:MAG: WD40 repeat domain-containing protein [Fuerstiella sp.]